MSKRDLLRFMRLYRGKPLREIIANDMNFWRKVESRGNKLYESEKRKALASEKISKQKVQQRLADLSDENAKPSHQYIGK